MSDTPFRDSGLTLITDLCRELAKLGVNVGLSDAAPAAIIRPRVRRPFWVTVDRSRQFYECPEADKRYPVTSPAQAATSIAEAVKAESDLGTEEEP